MGSIETSFMRNPDNPKELINILILHTIKYGSFIVAYQKGDGEIVIGEWIDEQFTAYPPDKRQEVMPQYEQLIQEYIEMFQSPSAQTNRRRPRR